VFTVSCVVVSAGLADVHFTAVFSNYSAIFGAFVCDIIELIPGIALITTLILVFLQLLNFLHEALFKYIYR